MIIAKITGGLGNQLFQYAMARRLAERRGVPLKLDVSTYVNGHEDRPREFQQFARRLALVAFRVAAEPATADEIAALRDPYQGSTTRARLVRRLVRPILPGFGWPRTHFVERAYRFDPGVLELDGHVYVEGYWQSPRYFTDVEAVIRRELVPRDAAVAQYARDYVARLRDGRATPVVAVHVRRGDLAHAHEVLGQPHKLHGAPVTTDYIHQAMARFDPACRFLVFSDSARDIEWCKQNIAADALHFSEGHDEVQDFAIMAACDHQITANSTYSWWAAWLNPNPAKRVVAPSRWSAPQSRTQMVTDDLIPPEWEVIESLA